MDPKTGKNALKTAITKRFPDGSQVVSKWLPDGYPKGLFFGAAFLTSRRLVNGVSFLLHFVGLGYLSVISRTWVRDATVRGFSADLEISGSYETTEGN